MPDTCPILTCSRYGCHHFALAAVAEASGSSPLKFAFGGNGRVLQHPTSISLQQYAHTCQLAGFLT